MKTLVIYYSVSGNTRALAKRIAQALKADLYEIATVKSYPDDFDVLVSLGKKEVESGYMPQLAVATPPDFDAYDAIVIGTPVWWYTFAPAVKSFLASVDWHGKKVYPFATNGGWLGHTAGDFKRAMRGAKVAPLLSVRFENRTMTSPESEFTAWLNGLR